MSVVCERDGGLWKPPAGSINVSDHLGCLRDCGLVTAKSEGRFAYYRLSDSRVEQLLRLADELLADVARGVYECTRYNIRKGAKRG